MALAIVLFVPLISLTYQTALFGGAFAFYGLFGLPAFVEQALGVLLLGGLSYVFGGMVVHFIWRTPVVTGNAKGLIVKGRSIAWKDFKGVQVQRLSGKVGAANFVKVMVKRGVSIKDHEMSGSPESMADAITAYADVVRRHRMELAAAIFEGGPGADPAKGQPVAPAEPDLPSPHPEFSAISPSRPQAPVA